jgi:hypothetical protein
MRNRLIPEGEKFKRLTYLHDATPQKRNCGRNKRMAIFKCECGNILKACVSDVVSGNTSSCGCLKMDKIIKHGLYLHPLHRVWRGIKERCLNPNFHQFKDYGGRGIGIYSEWVNDFKSFYDWCINNGWQKGLQIDRQDNSGNYSPDNCRCVTRSQNQLNRRDNNVITFNSETMCLKEWSDHLNMNVKTLSNRVKRGWPIEKALTAPTQKRANIEC